MNKKRVKLFLLYLIVSFLIGGVFYKVVYSLDAYTIVGYGIENYNKYALGNMRPLQYIITHVFMYFLGSNVKYEVIYILYLTISLFLLAFSMFLVYTHIIKLINENEKIPKLTKFKKVLIFICIIFMFFNKYLSDNLIYLENLTMILSLFLAVVASILYSKNIKCKNMVVLSLLIISEFSYQTMITAFVVFSLLFYALKNNQRIDIKYLIKISVLFMIPLLLLFGFSKINIEGITVNDRYATPSEYIDIILMVGVQAIIYIVIYILYYYLLSIIFKFITIDKENKYNLLFIVIFTVIFTYSFGLINLGTLSNRMAWCIGSLASIICLFIIIYRDDVNSKKKRYIFGIFITLSIEMILYFSLYNVYVGYNNNVKQNAMNIINYIDNWNAEHEVKIDKVAIYKDDDITESEWFSIVAYLNFRIYNVEDNFYTQIKIFSKNRIAYAEQSEEVFDKYFKEKDWQELNLEQFVVIKDTLHFCKY